MRAQVKDCERITLNLSTSFVMGLNTQLVVDSCAWSCAGLIGCVIIVLCFLVEDDVMSV